MFFHNDIKGDRLPEGTLCLTYDDGPGQVSGPEGAPGPRTLELGTYLTDNGIAASFFVVGRFAREQPGILAELRRLGHLVGNHTMNHPGLVALVRRGGDALHELVAADESIGGGVSRPATFFRAPYGNWREAAARGDRPTSEVAELWNRELIAHRYVGPINWDVSGHDYDYWRRGRSASECAEEYLERIERARRGIVLMHDSSEDPAIRASNRTFELTRILVATLRRRGYRFVRLDEIPQVRSAARVSRQVAWRTEDGRFLRVAECGTRVARAGTEVGPREQFGLVHLGDDRVVIRACNGAFLSHDADDGNLSGLSDEIGPGQVFRRQHLGAGHVRLSPGAGRRPSSSHGDGASPDRLFEVDLFPA